MVNYRLMYSILCGAISDALDDLYYTPENLKAILILINALQKTEDLYIETEEQ